VAACPTDSIGIGEDDLPTLVKMCTGCSASCAQPQIGDIGFRGETAKTDDGIVEGVDVGLGGSLGKDAAFIDWVEGAMPADEVPEALARVFERFGEEGRPGERFHEWARRKKNGELRDALRGRTPVTVGRK
jgi:ferredoxin-nitrite reductase